MATSPQPNDDHDFADGFVTQEPVARMVPSRGDEITPAQWNETRAALSILLADVEDRHDLDGVGAVAGAYRYLSRLVLHSDEKEN